MALDSYAGLLATLPVLAVRGDQTANWPTYVQMAEAQMSRDLRVQPMQTRAEAVLDSEFFTVPGDFLEVVSFEIIDPVVRLKSTSAGNLSRMREREDAYRREIEDALCTSPAPPAWYARVGAEFRVFPAPEDGNSWDAELTYFARIPALSGDNPTNWLLEDGPDAYLYGALVAFAMTAEDERLGAWSQAYQAALEAIRRNYAVETDKAELRTEFPILRCF